MILGEPGVTGSSLGARVFVHATCGARIASLLDEPLACYTQQGGCGRHTGSWLSLPQADKKVRA